MRRLTAAAAAAALLLLVACSPDAADFQEEAEKYIESREFSEDAGLLRFTEADCEEPESTATDTLFTCAALAEDGSRWQFGAEITGKTELKVILPPVLLEAAPAGSTIPDDSSPPSTASAPTTTSSPGSAPTTTGPTTADPTTTAAATTTT